MKGGALKREIEVRNLFSFLYNAPTRNVTCMFKIKEKQIGCLRVKDNDEQNVIDLILVCIRCFQDKLPCNIKPSGPV